MVCGMHIGKGCPCNEGDTERVAECRPRGVWGAYWYRVRLDLTGLSVVPVTCGVLLERTALTMKEKRNAWQSVVPMVCGSVAYGLI